MLKRLLYLLLLLFVLSYTCFSRDLTTDELLTIADEALNEADKDLAKQEIQITGLEKDLESSSETITLLEKEPAILNRIILAQEKEYDLQEKLLKKQKTETILDKIYNFFIGVLFGSCAVTIIYLINL
jgi:hypothetical protein